METIGDAYMVVSGAPEITVYHALNICNMALDMIASMVELSDPSTGGHMRIRVGKKKLNTQTNLVALCSVFTWKKKTPQDRNQFELVYIQYIKT